MKICIFTLLFSLNAFSFNVYIPKRLKSRTVHSYAQNVIMDIYKSIGVTAKLVYMTEQEINKNLKSASFDAVLGKISDSSIIPNSIKIKPAIVEKFEIFAWKRKKSKAIRKGIKIGAIEGVIAHTKTLIKNRSRFKSIKYYKDFESMFMALEKSEVDSVLLYDMEFAIEIPKTRKLEIEKIPGALLTLNLNHYVNNKHKSIAKSLGIEFKKRHKLKELSFNDYLKRLKSRKVTKP